MGNLVLEQENKREKGFVPPLNEIFVTPKKLSIAQHVIHQDTIHSLDGEGDEIKDAIRRAKEDEALLNCTSEPIIDIWVSKDFESKFQEMNFKSLSIDSIGALEYDDQGCDEEVDDYEEFEKALQISTRDLGPSQ
ncbi:hypothetical protein PIB30_109988 [Stylosanthes scabra]|uniref:Uncharacterized protein n=1 Tax=Stylosanthes scabra TaxID=79078 RepID=A0ABU6T094_9FABA|nr:hypothetical protein [Stylosanthes scabra]